MEIIIEYLKQYPLPVLIILQLPLILVLLFAVRILYNELKRKENVSRTDLKNCHKKVDTLNTHIRESEKNNYKTLQDLVTLIEDIETNQKIILNKIDKL